MTSNRPLEDWGKLIGDVPSATAILDRFLHHAEIIRITGRSYRLRNQGRATDDAADESKPATAPIGSDGNGDGSQTPGPGKEAKADCSKPATAPTGSKAPKPRS